MMQHRDFDLIVVGSETEGCLAAVAAHRAGARAALIAAPRLMLGGLLTEGGLAYVDRDSRHLTPPAISPHDGLFGQFMARAGVPLVALEPFRGASTLELMLAEAGVQVVRAGWRGVRREGDRLASIELTDGRELSASFFLDATPDADLAEAAGMRFAAGFAEAGLEDFLGFSPLPRVAGVAPAQIMATCQELARDPILERLRQQKWGDRQFLPLEQGEDYLLIGPPHLGLAYQRWREQRQLAFPYPFEADGFNVAILGARTTSWNGLMYFSRDLPTLLRLSRAGTDEVFRREALYFQRFLREGLGWELAAVEPPRGMYVRQTRHAREVAHRLSLGALTRSEDHDSVGTFCYYPDFRGFRAVAWPHPLTAHISLGAGLAAKVPNLGLATRAGGYTPFAHSLCRLVQYNATLGVALGVAAAMAQRELAEVAASDLREHLTRLDLLAADPAGFSRNTPLRLVLERDPVLRLEAV